jgi:hypothetical protein
MDHTRQVEMEHERRLTMSVGRSGVERHGSVGRPGGIGRSVSGWRRAVGHRAAQVVSGGRVAPDRLATVVEADGEAPMWTLRRCRRHDVKELTGKFGSLSASSPKPSG